jgi:transcriptional regulator with XRE-family HTH domain
MNNPVEESLNQIGSNIRKMRQCRQMTIDSLAEEARLRPATISDIENGKSNFEYATLLKICSALNCTLDIIITPYKK